MTLRFTLTDYTIDPAGNQIILDDEPEGWQDLQLMLKRSVGHGVDFDASLNKLSFHGEAFLLIKNAYTQSGLNAETDLLIEVLCQPDAQWVELYHGRLIYEDLDLFYGDYCAASISLEQISCVRNLKARFGHKVDLLSTQTFDGSDLLQMAASPTEIQLPNRPIILTSRGEHDDCFDPAQYGFIDVTDGSPNTYIRFYTFQLLVKKDDLATFQPIYDTDTTIGSPVDYRFIINDLIEPIFVYRGDEFECTENPAPMQLDITMTGTITNSSDPVPGGSAPYNCSIRLFRYDVDDVFVEEIPLQTFNGDYQNSPVVAPVSINFSQVFQLNAGDQIFLALCHDHESFGSNDLTLQFTDPVIVWNAQVVTECPETYTNVIPMHEALNTLVASITNNCLFAKSEFFGRVDSEPFDFPQDGAAGLTGITSGLLVRRAAAESACSEDGAVIDGVPPTFFVSLEETMRSLQAIYNVGFGTESNSSYGHSDIFVVEPIRYFYQNVTILTCEDVKEIRVNVLKEKNYGKVKIGYSDWQIESSNGLDEICSTREYRTELSAVSNTLTLMSDFIAGGYPLELCRRIGSSSEDTRFDDKIFILCLERIYGNIFSVEVFQSLVTQNIISATNIINLRLSVVRNLLRHYKSIRTPGNDTLTFNAGDGNFNAETRVTTLDAHLLEDQSALLSERETIDQTTFKSSDDSNPVFLPEVIEFEYPLSLAQYLSIKLNPRGKIVATQGANTFSGFLQNMVWKPAEGLAKFTLLRAA